MPVKLLMSWDIAPEHEQEYFEFVVREFIPGVQRMGFELSDEPIEAQIVLVDQDNRFVRYL